MSRFLSNRLSGINVYIPGEQPRGRRYIKLNTNESPYPPSPEVISAVSSGAVQSLNLYSDPTGLKLRQRLAAYYGVEAENVCLANGSDEALNFSFMAFCDEGHGVMFPEITYGFYEVLSGLYRIPAEKVPLREDFSIDYRDYCDAGKMVVIANPNAPTGMALPLSQIEEIVRSNPDNVVLIDEAYVDFGGESCIPLIAKYDNILVVQTYSKSRSMAGGRLGYAIGGAELINDLEKIRNSTTPYNINSMTMAAGIATIDSDAYYKENVRKIVKTREETAGRLRELGFTVLPSSTNFVFAKTEAVSGGALYSNLKDRGILVRHFDGDRVRDFVRITIGTPEQMDELIGCIREILTERGGIK